MRTHGGANAMTVSMNTLILTVFYVIMYEHGNSKWPDRYFQMNNAEKTSRAYYNERSEFSFVRPH